MKCSRCVSEEYCKDGIVQGRQRFKCKKCNYRYTVERKSDVKSSETRRLALEMYNAVLLSKWWNSTKYTRMSLKKNYCWVWIAVDRYGKRFVSFVCGDRSTQTGLRLWDDIKGLTINMFASDYWKSYEEFIPSEKHLQSKAETYTVEGYNSRIRHYLARFKRKTKCYSKAEYMIVISLNLLFLKLNNELSIWI